MALASVLRDLGQPEAARPLLERALAIDEAANGPDDPRVAADLNNLASVLSDLGQPEAARPLLERALAIAQNAYPSNSSHASEPKADSGTHTESGKTSGKDRGSVFISYSPADSRFVKDLVDHLSDAGFNVLWDMDLPPGAQFSEVLVETIGSSDHVIAVMSPDYFASSWAQGELAAALSREKRILPILIRPTRIEGPLSTSCIPGRDR